MEVYFQQAVEGAKNVFSQYSDALSNNLLVSLSDIRIYRKYAVIYGNNISNKYWTVS